jgi:hypothetical protein
MAQLYPPEYRVRFRDVYRVTSSNGFGCCVTMSIIGTRWRCFNKAFGHLSTSPAFTR